MIHFLRASQLLSILAAGFFLLCSLIVTLASHSIVHITRRKLGLKTEKLHGSYVVAATEGPKLARLLEKYGVSTGQEDLGDYGDFAQGDERSRFERNLP